jgi:ElaB/YqjD/DUF883 family membrane-anchored ribosome-binding protein
MTDTPPDDPRTPLDSAGRPLNRPTGPQAGPRPGEQDIWSRDPGATRDPWLDRPAPDPHVADPHAYGDDLGFGPDDDPASYLDDEDHDDEGGFVSTAVGAVRNNPVGSALVLAGLALLAAPRLERDTVRAQGRRLQGRAQDQYARLKGQARGAYATQKAGMGARTHDLRARITEGTEDMGEAARKRVIAARRRALDMTEQARDGLRSGASETDRMIRDNPLAAGALAIAAGAAIAAALPRTRMETRRFGSAANRFWDEARAVFEEERARVVAGANAAMDEARSMATEAVRDVKDAVPDGEEMVGRTRDQARDAAKRVSDAAREGARAEGAGTEDKSGGTSSRTGPNPP